MLNKLLRSFLPNPLDVLLKKAASQQHTRFLITWNRGLGDIALGLYALVYQIRSVIPDARITFVTRGDLKEGFALLENVNVIVGEEWRRGKPFDLDQTLATHHLSRSDFDQVLENPDVTRWLKWQIGTLIPKLRWNPDWDLLWQQFDLAEDATYVCVHVQTETSYAYEKNWPLESWKTLFGRLTADPSVRVFLFGFEPKPVFAGERIIDLRGKTNLFELLSIVKNRCRYLIVPDSGVLSLTYYLDVSFPIQIISLWADPRQGVLKQNVSSPNPQLRHLPLMGKEEKVSSIQVDEVMGCL
jgi:ADP-heptose:LPS heptosyltransferase